MKPTRVIQRRGSRSGLTLLELVVVLAILSALSTVMIAQTGSLTDESRFRKTVRTLESLEHAVLGRAPVGTEDPSGVVPGFVSDMGRLPQADAALGLSELWDEEPFFNAGLLFQSRVVAGLDSDLVILSGWRGPYLRLPVGADLLVDGWGVPHGLSDGDGLAVDAVQDPVGRVSSDGSGRGDAFDPVGGLGVVFVDTSIGIDRVSGTLPTDALRVRYTLPNPAAGGEHGVVRLYGVQDGLPALLAQSEVFSGQAGESEELTVEFLDASTGLPLLAL
ncbi:MAG: prepilin-type N-terminal cleavage/methylation domain-containing protein, partial [Planctomycetota bacterium]